MVKSRIFDNKQLLKEHPEIPHYKEEVVCFMSEYKDRSYPENERYFNRELYMILVLEGRSEILLNGEFIVIEPDMLLVHGANTIQLTAYEAQIIRNELEVLMHLLNIKHQFLFRRIQAACNALFLDIADFLSRKTIIKKEVSRKDHVLQEFHALVTRNFREEHFVSFYADKLAISEQYLARIVRAEPC